MASKEAQNLPKSTYEQDQEAAQQVSVSWGTLLQTIKELLCGSKLKR